MIARLIIGILIWVVQAYCHAQPITFSKTYDYNEGFEIPIGILITDSGYVFCGVGSDFVEFSGWRVNKIFFTDKYGNLTNKKLQGKKGGDYYGGLQPNLTKGPNNNYLINMTFYDTLIKENNFSFINFDKDGDTIFVKSYGGNEDDYGYTVAATKDKGYAVFGQTYSYGNPPNGDYYLVKTDSMGNMQWQQSYIQSANALGLTVSNTYDNGFLLGGRAFDAVLNNEAVVIKTDSLGNEQWRKNYGGSKNDCGAQVVVTQDSGFIFISCQDTIINVSNTYGFYYIAKADKWGNVEWKRFMNNENVHFLLSARELPQGGYIVCGHVEDTIISPTVVARVGWLIRLDNQGNILWERRYTYQDLNMPLGFTVSEFVDVQPTTDKGFVVLGQTSDINQDLWVLKLDSNGCLGNYCGLTDPNCYYLPYPTCITNIDPTTLEEGLVKVYPNPSSQEINIQLENVQSSIKIKEVKVYDVAGREVHSQRSAVHSNGVSLNVEGFANGLYFLEVQLSNGSVERVKFVKQ